MCHGLYRISSWQKGSERFYHEVLEDSIRKTGSTLLRTATNSFLPSDCCKQHVGLVQLNQFFYSPSQYLLHTGSHSFDRLQLQALGQSRLWANPNFDAELAWLMHKWKILRWTRHCLGSPSNVLRLGCDRLGEQAIDRDLAKGRKYFILHGSFSDMLDSITPCRVDRDYLPA